MTSKGRWIIGGATVALTMAMAAGAVRLQDKLFRNTGVTAMAVRTAENNSLGVAAVGQTTKATVGEDEIPGLRFRLSEGKPLLGEATDTVPLAETTPLSDADADRILDRLKAVGAKPGDVQDFALREGSLPPPRAGQTIGTTFPPPPSEGTAPAVETGPLEVRRVQPEGDVPLADRVSVTFSQPMIPVTSQEEAAKTVPVKLTPSVPGTWRWLGTQTLIFDAGSGKRLPMATSYTLTIPAGTKSATNGTLADAKTVTFQTPTVRLIDHLPNDGQPQPRQPLIWLAFDQRVDPDAVMKTVTLDAGGKKYAVRLATDAEVAKESELKWRNDVPKDRTVALKPVEPLPTGTSVSVQVGPGTPSLEGPRKTDSAQNIAFATYGPLKLIQTYGDGNPPGGGWNLHFNNPLDMDAFDPETIKIAPKLDGVQIIANGNYVSISGPTKGSTTYTVTVPATLKDAFGQTLGKAETRKFKVGPATPYLVGPQQTFVVCDPSAPARAVFQSVNTPSVKVKLYAVNDGDWAAYLTYRNRGRRDKGTPPGRLGSEQTVALKTEKDAFGETSVPVGAALKNGRGNVVVHWVSTIRRGKEEPDQGTVWLQATKLGLMAQVDTTDLYAWVTDLATGKPIKAANVELAGGGQKETTGADGMAKIALSDQSGKRLVVRRGDDTAFLPSSQWEYNDSSWMRRGQSDSQRWFLFDDRKLYRPGETTRVKGWVRVQKAGKTGDLELPNGMTDLSWTLNDAQGNEVRKGTVPVNAWAGFDITLELPKTMNLGQAQLVVGGISHYINVQEFRRPEFEVSAKNETAGPHVVADPKGADLSVSAKYYAGGSLPNTPVNWSVTASATTYTPPGREEFTFGKWTPWWGNFGGMYDGGYEGIGYRGYGRRFPGGVGGGPVQHAGRTGGDGTHYLHLDFDAVRPAQPYTVSAQAVLQDVNRQTQAANASLIVHPSERYVGLRGKNLFVEKGKKLTIETVVCDIEGKTDSGREIRFRAARKEWGYTKGRWSEKEVDIQEWTVRSGEKPVATEFLPKSGGQWTVKATVLDSKERPNESELTLWVSGGDGPKNKQRNLGQEMATLIPSQKEYKAGDTATILVQSPFANAEGLVSIIRDGIVRAERFTMKGTTHTLRIPIAETFLPTVGVQVELVGTQIRTDDAGDPIKGIAPRPAFAGGHLDLSVPPTARRLTVTAEPAVKALEPGGKTTVTVSVKDASGKPVSGAEAAVVIVDESVLALAGWNLGDPLAAFYPGRQTNVETQHLRQYVVLEDPAQVSANGSKNELRSARSKSSSVRAFGVAGGGGASLGMSAPMPAAPAMSALADSMDAEGAREDFSLAQRVQVAKPEPGTPIALRTNFDALAEFAPSVKTDADGTARVPVTLPDNLTRYRIVVVAVAGAKQIGHGEAALTARLPLMARPSAPRFLNFGDKFELPIVLQNQTDEPMTVEVAVRGTNLKFTKNRGQRLTVKANDRIEVRFPAEAVQAGTARFQVAAVAGNRSDAAELSLPVWTPATTEAFATYGVLDNGAVVQPIQTPGEVVPQFGGLEITTTSTALQELTDAYIYLAQYPYGCAEQISSRVLATAALKDVLTAFKTAELPKPEEMQAAMGRDLARLAEMQNDDGGYGFWTRYTKPYPYLGVHVAHAAVRAKQKGFAVPDTMYKRSMEYLKAIESKFDGDYGPQTRRMITAYALYVRHLAGDTDTARAKKLLGEDSLDNLGPETVGWLLNILAGDPAMAKARTWLNNKATETAGAAHFTFSYSDDNYLILHSDRRADAIVLDALIADQPKSDLIPKLVRGLLDGRRRGHWYGTQENAFVLLALDRYFRTYEGVTPDFVARLWLGDKFAGEGEFKGRSTKRVETQIPMAYLAQTPGVQKLTIGKTGAGRMYYRVGMRYAPKNLSLKPADYGFTVKRTYEAIDKPTDVRREGDGSWVVRAGAKVRVRLSMVATTRRYHVALVDPLPAGFESLNSELQGTESVDRDSNPSSGGGRYGYWWWGHWWEHENLRDERAEAFTAYLWEGAYEYVYVCRATTPGQFIVPPAKAEEMYSPETFGRTGTDRVRVE
ncbi:MAG: Ig-like domain-containing protein [Fibrella sp.]|nr:Ig-like domain-containing protein [Armatimonadota bacterium]